MNHFEKYINLIRKSAHHYSSIFNIEYEELEAQGFLIYCECLNSYDITKASFSTHLMSELRRLKDYCEALGKHDWHKGYSIDDETKNPDLPFNELPSLENLLESASGCLSEFAYKVFAWILGRDWEKKGRAKPTMANACEHFNVSVNAMKKVWNEIGVFYRTELVF